MMTGSAVAMIADDLDWERDGAALHHGAALSCLDAIESVLADVPIDRAGVRLRRLPGLAYLLDPGGAIGSLAAAQIGMDSMPVRAILFDKSPNANWSLDWHQDRTIAVQAHRAVAGFGPQTIKAGIPHVEPPFEIIERMVTLRMHLDAVPESNAPLLIAPGSHRLGRILDHAVDEVVRRSGSHACLADRGDVWAYSTPILHASAVARMPSRRRVLQIDYSADTLPGGMQWAGI